MKDILTEIVITVTPHITLKKGQAYFDEQIHKRGQHMKDMNSYQKKWKQVMKGNVTPKNKDWLIENAYLISQLEKELGVTLPQELDSDSLDTLRILNEATHDKIVKRQRKNRVDALVLALNADIEQLKANRAERRICLNKGLEIRTHHTISAPKIQATEDDESDNKLRLAAQDVGWLAQLWASIIPIVQLFWLLLRR